MLPLLFWLFGFIVARAADPIVLFDSRGEQVEDYETRLSAVGPGSELRLSDGKGGTRRVTVVRKLSGEMQGSTTAVFETSTGTALRLPKRSGMASWEPPASFASLVTDYLTGQRRLLDAGIPVPRILGGVAGQYAEVEKLTISFSLSDVLEGKVRDSPEKAAATEGLVAFARTTSRFVEIGDFNSGQMVWVKNRGWILLDWVDDHTDYNPRVHARDVNVFRHLEERAREFGREEEIAKIPWARIHDSIRVARRGFVASLLVACGRPFASIARRFMGRPAR